MADTEYVLKIDGEAVWAHRVKKNGSVSGAGSRVSREEADRMVAGGEARFEAVPGHASGTELRRFANEVRRTGMGRGREEDLLTAVRTGYLSMSDAMNLDD